MPSLLFQIENTATQTVASNSFVNATYNNIVSNTAQVTWSPPSYTNQAQVSLEGNYVITATVGMGTNTTGNRLFYIYIAPAISPTDWFLIGGHSTPATPTGQKNLCATAVARLAIGTLVRVVYFQNSGGNITTTTMSVANGTPNATLSIALVY